MDKFLYNKLLFFILIIFSSTFFSQFFYTFFNYIDSPIKILFMSFIKLFVIGTIFLIFLFHERSLEFIKISKWFILSGIILFFNEFFREIENINNFNTFIKISKQIFYTKYVSTYLTSTFIFAIFEFFFRKRKFDIKYLNICLNLLIFVALILIFNRLFGEGLLPFYIFQQFINNNTIAYEMILGIIILFYFNNLFNKSFIVNFKLTILGLVPIFLSGRGAILCLIIILLLILIHFKNNITYYTKFTILALVSLNGISLFQQMSISPLPINSSTTASSLPINSSSTDSSLPINSSTTDSSLPINSSTTDSSLPFNFKAIEVAPCIFKLDKSYIDSAGGKNKLSEFNYKDSINFSKNSNKEELSKCVLIYDNILNKHEYRSLISDDFFSIQSRLMVDYISLKIAYKNILNGIGNKAYKIKFDNVGIHSLWALILVSNGLIFLIPIFYSIFKYFSQFETNIRNKIFIPVFMLLIFEILFINQFNYIYSFCLIIPMIYTCKRYKIGSQ